MQKRVTGAITSQQLEATSTEPVLSSEAARKAVFEHQNVFDQITTLEAEKTEVAALFDAIKFRFQMQDELYRNAIIINSNIQFTDA